MVDAYVKQGSLRAILSILDYLRMEVCHRNECEDEVCQLGYRWEVFAFHTTMRCLVRAHDRLLEAAKATGDEHVITQSRELSRLVKQLAADLEKEVEESGGPR